LNFDSLRALKKELPKRPYQLTIFLSLIFYVMWIKGAIKKANASFIP